MKIESDNIVKYLGNIDLLLIASGFEDRSKTLSFKLDKSLIKNSVIFHLNDNYISASNNKDEIISKLEIKEIIEYSKNDSFETYNLFYENIKEKVNIITIESKLSVVIDMTAFSREILLILIKVLTNIEFYHHLEIKFIHTPVENYSNDENLWLTKGVREIRPVFGYSGLMMPSKKLLLIVLNGFEDERTEIIIESFEPYALVLANPSLSGSINKDLKTLVDIKYDKIKYKFKNLLVEENEFSCKEIKSTIDFLESSYSKYQENYNIAVSPLNNKASTLAVAISALKNENIQVCYASANQYNITKQLTPSNYFLVYNLSDYFVI
jgi:hypothetical protein